MYKGHPECPVNIARKKKPEIPLMNPENHIPIRDEFLFVKEIQ
jgi:hypothetical protein